MAKVIASEVSSANSDNISNIELVIETCKSEYDAITTFNSSSNSILQGGGYDAVRVKLSLYAEIFQVLMNVCSNYINNITSANNGMINYMEGYSELDDSKLSEITSRIQNIDQIISYLTYMASNSKSGIDYSAAIRYYEQMKSVLVHLKELLQGLSPCDNALYAALAPIMVDAVNVLSATEGINESTFTATGMQEFKNGTGYIYKFEEKEAEYSTGIVPKEKEYQQRAWNDAVAEYCRSKGYPVWSNFGASGCGTCTAAEVYSNLLGREVNPFEIIDHVNEHWGKSKTTSSDNLFVTLASDFGCKSHSMTCSEANVRNCLQNGGQVATVINGGAHYISIVGYDSETNTYTVFDSYYLDKSTGSGYRTMTWSQFVSYRNGSGICYEIYKEDN